MAICNTAGLKSSFYIRRVLIRNHKKPNKRKLPLIDYYEEKIAQDNKETLK